MECNDHVVIFGNRTYLLLLAAIRHFTSAGKYSLMGLSNITTDVFDNHIGFLLNKQYVILLW